MTTATNEQALVRNLARQVQEMALAPRMEVVRRRWRDVNALRKPDRAPVWCRPVGCWREIIPDSALVAADPWLRSLEYQFRQILFKRDVDDDTPVEPWYGVPAALTVEPANVWGVEIGRHRAAAPGGAWAYDPPLKEESDFEKLRTPQFGLDRAATQRNVERTSELLDGIIPVRVVGVPPLGATLGTAAADLRGLEQMMLDMAIAPELLHRLMAYLRDATLAGMDAIEAMGILTPDNTGPMTCSDPLPGAEAAGSAASQPRPPEGGTTNSRAGQERAPVCCPAVTQSSGGVTCRQLWCMANSQEFDQVSPAMWAEFCLAYQAPIFARFGLVGYGCCENLTRKIAGVLSIPNLRIFTCSAWTDLDRVLDACGKKYCIMWRQKASDVVFSDDANVLRAALCDGARRLQGSYYQIVLRELETLAGHPDRLHVWTRLAKDAAERYA